MALLGCSSPYKYLFHGDWFEQHEARESTLFTSVFKISTGHFISYTFYTSHIVYHSISSQETGLRESPSLEVEIAVLCSPTSSLGDAQIKIVEAAFLRR